MISRGGGGGGGAAGAGGAAGTAAVAAGGAANESITFCTNLSSLARRSHQLCQRTMRYCGF